MRPTDRNLVDRLASEYVLGTLRGRARRRFERWRASSPLVEERCTYWENRLVHLAKGVAPLAPPPHVWQGIRTRLGFVQRRRSSALRNYAVAAGILLVVGLGLLTYWRTAGPIQPTQVATITPASGVPAWTVEIFGRSARLTVRTGTLPPKAADRDYELWALPTGGSPVSLGVLPGTGVSQRSLTAAQLQALTNAPQLAVSVEPTGGSTTGQPTGPVIIVAPLRAT
ncbi:MAG TPA: anti-sigma factor [Steroidobacteraceae bacterium]|jgi:anti-sigma-K factor RskA